MHSLQNFKRRTSRTALMLTIGGVLVLGILGVIHPSGLTRVVLSIARPLHLVRNGVLGSAEGAVSGFRSNAELVQENEQLSEALRKAQVKAELFDELHRKISVSEGEVSAHTIVDVLAAPPLSPYDTLLLDGGSNKDIAPHDAVSFDDTVALGTIDTVTEKTSRVTLFSSPGVEQSVRVGAHDFLVVAHGVGGGAFQLRVLKDEDVARGDGIFLPSGQLLARVEKVVQDESDAFVLVYAVVPFNLFELREVVIAKP